MIGIIGAMDQEISHLVKKMDVQSTVILGGRRFYIGNLNSRDVVITKAGIGKTNASVTATLLLERFDIDYVINVGVAGGLLPAKQLDLVLCDGTVYHDVDIFGNEYGQIQDMPHIYPTSIELTKKASYVAKKMGMRYLRGIVASGDQFVTDSKKLDRIRKSVKEIVAVEMEGASIAQVSYIYGKPFIIIRVISDVLDSKEQLKEYEEIKDEACQKNSDFVFEFIK